MLALIVEGSVPVEVVRLDVHGGGDVIAVGPEQIPPRFGIVVAKTRGVLTLQRENMSPHIPAVLIQLPHGFLQVHSIFITKEPVVTQPFRTRPGCNVLHVAVRLLHLKPVFLQRSGDKDRGIGLGGLVFVIGILTQLLRLREILCQFGDELLLLSSGRTVIWDDLHPFPCADVPQITADRTASSALEIRTFHDQSCHSSSSSHAPRTRCSSEMRPLVFRTF